MKFTEDKEFGNYFAGEERKQPVNNPERNTQEENKIIGSILSHIEGCKDCTGIQKPEAIKLTNALKTKEYSDLIVPPISSVVYRGMGITKASLAKTLKAAQINWQEAMNLKEGKLENLSVKFTPLKPKKGSSWTIDFNTAFDFARFVNKNEVILILTATVVNNPNKFFDLRKWYEEIDKVRSDEKEVVGLGTIIVNKIEWLIRE